MAKKAKPVERRFSAQKGQGVIDWAKPDLVGGTVGIDVEQPLNPDFASYAATRRYSHAELQAAFEADPKQMKFEDFVDGVMARREVTTRKKAT
jgi:hypothetical protein